MKKIASLFIALSCAAALQAQNIGQMRIYINPGHGSWTSNDRPCTLVDHTDKYSMTNTDTLAFYESSTNLYKALGMLDKLREYGFTFDPALNAYGLPYTAGAARDMDNNIVLSRVKTGPFDAVNGMKDQAGPDWRQDGYAANRSLSEIAAEVEANNFDIFVSIHSNALKEGTDMNFPLYLYRGYDVPRDDDGQTYTAIQQASRDMAVASWPYSWENPHMAWSKFSADNMYIKGDFDFYGNSYRGGGYRGYLGVLRHSVPGYLVEGYFHTYQPARHRAMNVDVSRLEGAAYAHGIARYLGLPPLSTGAIYGIVRDAGTRFSNEAYTPNQNTDDVYKPLNGAKVTLVKDGALLDNYTTDNYNNGAYVFTNLQPGEYVVIVNHPGYDTELAEKVYVTAGQNTYPRHFFNTDKTE